MPGILPPKDISPARLFRILSSKQPRILLAYRFSFLPDTPLHCRALTPGEWISALDGPDYESAVTSLALADEEGRPMLSFQRAQSMPTRDLAELVDAIETGLWRCSPRYATIDHDAWERALRTGAESNAAISLPLGGCYEIHNNRFVDRPDRFFGCPVSELNDGHWMAYFASRSHFERIHKQ